MSTPTGPGQASHPALPPRAGLCETCGYQQLVRTTRGSVFSLCRRSRDQPDYPRYPRLPVHSCPGYQARTAPHGAAD